MSVLNRAIIHHTAGGEFNTQSLADTKAYVRAIQNEHMNNRGYSDIAYHFLVDKFGNILEGRAGSITSWPRGAHDGTNTNSFGFNCMGYFHPGENDVPTVKMMESLYKVIAWRMPNGWQPYGSPGADYGPLGNSVGFLDGHRRIKATACPGDGLFNVYMGTNMNAGVMRAEIRQRINGIPTPPASDSDNATLVTDFSGNVWYAGIKTDGRLYTRRFDAAAGVWNTMMDHGADWSEDASPAMAGQVDGTMRLFAIKSNGALWSRKWMPSGPDIGWSKFSEQELGWATDGGVAAVRQLSGDITIAAVKADGTLMHRTLNPGSNSWGGFGSHSTAWSTRATPCLIAGTDGRLWLFAVKADGDIYHRSWTPSGWTSFELDSTNWSALAGPAGTARPNGAITWAAVKSDGDIYSRNYQNGAWSTNYDQHSPGPWSQWTSPALAAGTDGKMWLFGVKLSGTIYHKSWTAAGGWDDQYYPDEPSTDWSIYAGPVVTAQPNGNITWIATNDTGGLFTRALTGSWEDMTPQGTGWVR